MEETKRKTGKAKKKKSSKSKPVIIINFNFNTFCYGHTCRHRKGEALAVKTPFHDFGEPDDNISGTEFGPGSKGVPD
jgi:hypothetical protein